jgi:parallel beta-helix repeat protein
MQPREHNQQKGQMINISRRHATALGLVAAMTLFLGVGLFALTLNSYGAPPSSPPWPNTSLHHPARPLDGTTLITPTAPFTVHLPVILGGQTHYDYYVSTQGDDGDDGRTRATAFRTVGRAMEVVQPGDAVLILAGVYNEAQMPEYVGNSRSPITLRGEDGAVLDGQRTRKMGFWCEHCTNLVIENLEFRNYTDVGIGVYLSSDITMRELEVHDNGFAVQLVGWELEGYGIAIDVCQRVTVEDSEVYQNGPQPQLPDLLMGTGINTYGCTDCVIRNNRSYSNIGGGILVEDSVNVLVEANEVFSNNLDATAEGWWDGGIWIDGGHDVTVVSNTFRSNLGPGIQISDEDHQQPYGYVLEGNVSVQNYYGIYIWNFGTADFPPENILRVSNNQIVSNTIQDIWIVPWECPPPDPCD